MTNCYQVILLFHAVIYRKALFLLSAYILWIIHNKQPHLTAYL